MRGKAHLLLVGALALLVPAACEDEPSPPGEGGGGAGEGGCAPLPPTALYTLVIRAEEGPLPSDTTLEVRWSAGDEPVFVLDDQSTHLTLEDGSNVVCDVPDTPKPESLTCELWTSGATEVEVTATGYDDHVETLTPDKMEDCDEPIPSETEIVLVEKMDMGER